MTKGQEGSGEITHSDEHACKDQVNEEYTGAPVSSGGVMKRLLAALLLLLGPAAARNKRYRRFHSSPFRSR